MALRAARGTPQGAASRERLLEAAIELFASRGYGGTAVSALCERAGVAATALYWHFESKQGLLAAAIDRAATTWTEQIEKSTREVPDPGRRLDRLVAGLRGVVEEHLDELALLLSTALHVDAIDGTSPAVRQSLVQIHERARGSIERGIEEALGRSLPDLDLVALTVFAHLDAIVITVRRSRPSPAELDRLFQHTREMIALAVLRSIQRAEGGGS